MTAAAPVLVTGATGFLGGALARRLLAQGRPVACLVRPGREPALPAGADPVMLSGAQDELRAAFAVTGAAVCFHLAAHFRAEHAADDIAPLVEANVGLTAAVADACVAAGIPKLVLAGTVWQNYGGPGYRPVSLYAATKQAARDVLAHFAHNAGLAVDVLKLADSYGPGDPRRKALNVLLDAARSGEPLGMSGGEQLLDLVHVDDVVTAFEGLAGPTTGWREFALSSGEPVTLRRLAAVVAEATGHSPDVEWGALPYRTLEAFEPWDAGPPPPGWRPAVRLADGVRQLWQQDEEAAR